MAQSKIEKITAQIEALRTKQRELEAEDIDRQLKEARTAFAIASLDGTGDLEKLAADVAVLKAKQENSALKKEENARRIAKAQAEKHQAEVEVAQKEADEFSANAEKDWQEFVDHQNAAIRAVDRLADRRDHIAGLQSAYGVEAKGDYWLAVGARQLSAALKVQLASYVENRQMAERG